ncbi:MAG: hypothetical protein AAFV19_03790 [Pseudomonadota bacterium]
MLIFRITCAILVAWATNWALSRPEAGILLQTVPEMGTLGPLAGAVVGYFNLSIRQGWGFVVAFANGIWAGVLAIFLAGVFYMTISLFQGIQTNLVQNFDDFVRYFGELVEPLIQQMINPPLLIVSLGATAVVGVVSEVIHWLLVRVRQRKEARSGASQTGM